MKDKLFSNMGLKLLAILLGFLVWVVVLNMDDSSITKQISNIPVKVINDELITDQNQLYDITEGETVDVIVKGRRSLVESLTAEDFVATADLSKLSVTNAAQIQVELKNKANQSKMSITVVDNMMLIELEEEKTQSYPVTVNTMGDIPDGYIIGNPVTTPNLVTVTGASSVIESIDRVEVTVDVSDRIEDVSATCTPVFYNQNNEVVAIEKLAGDISDISITVPIYKTKEVPVKVVTEGTLADMYAISGLEYGPTTLEVGGPADVLANLKNILIDDINVDGLNDTLETAVDVTGYLPQGVVVNADNETISIKVTVAPLIDKSVDVKLSDIGITEKNDDLDYTVSLEDESQVVIRGTAEAIKDLTATDLNISIDASKLYHGTNYVKLNIKNSSSYTVESSITVKVVVKRK